MHLTNLLQLYDMYAFVCIYPLSPNIYTCFRHNGPWSVCHRNQRFLFLDLFRCVVQLLGLGVALHKVDINIVFLFWMTFDTITLINSLVTICVGDLAPVFESLSCFYLLYSSFSLVFGLPPRILIMMNMDIGYDLFPICYGAIPLLVAMTSCIQIRDGLR